MPTVYAILNDPQGNPLEGAYVQARLAVEDDVHVYRPPTGVSLVSVTRAYTNSTGRWELNLVANALLTPADTVYEVTEVPQVGSPRISYIVVPNGAGPYLLEDILTDPPATLASSALYTHMTSTADAHDASAISYLPTGTVAASNVQDAITEIVNEGAHPDLATHNTLGLATQAELDAVSTAKANDNAVVHLTGAENITGLKTFLPSATSAVGVVVKALASQTGALTEWRNSADVVLAAVHADGRIGAGSNPESPVAATALTVRPPTASGQPLVLKGLASQTGKLLQVEDSAGTTLAQITNLGVVVATAFGTTGFQGSGYLVVKSGGAGSVAVKINGATGQTADLLRITDPSDATILSRVDKNGYIMTRKTSAPPDVDLASSEAAIWLDNTPGATKIMFKVKDSGGTVRTGSVSLS